MPIHMEFKKIAPISLLCATFIVGCSFQKNPNKGDNKEVVKVGMTKHELEDEIVKMDSTSFPDRLAYAIKSKDKALALKIIEQQPTEKINEYGSSGATAIEVAVKAGEDDLTMQLLRKGASPYLPRRGTAYSPFEYLQVQANQNRDVLDMIEISDRKLFEQGKNALFEGKTGVMEFIIQTRFPFLKKLRDGTRFIDQIMEDADEIAHGSSVFKCASVDFDVFFGLIEKIEGPITGISEFQYAKFGIITNTQSFYEKGLKSVSEFSKEQRVELLYRIAERYTTSSLMGAFADLQVTDLDQKDLSDIVLMNVRKISKKRLQSEMLDEKVQTFLIRFPDAYKVANDRAEMEKYRKAEQEKAAMATPDEKITNTNLPGGMEVPKGPIADRVNGLWQDLLDFDGNYKSCIDK